MNGIEVAKLLVSLATPLVVAALGYVFSRRLKEFEADSARRHGLEVREDERRREELERRYKPHIELTLHAQFFGPQKGFWLAEFVVCVTNKSLVRHDFKKIRFRVRGMKDGEQPSLLEGNEPRLAFPHKIVDTDLVPRGYAFLFAEPGVRQEITLVTPIAVDTRFVIARAEFSYDRYTPHNVERMFETGRGAAGAPVSGSTA